MVNPTVFHIALSNAQQVYYSGQVVSGTVYFSTSESKKARAIRLRLQGKVYTHWTTHSGSGKNRRTHHHSETVILTDQLINLWEDKSQKIPAGNYSFPFQFNLVPTTGVTTDQLPSSFETSNGHIRYSLTANVDRPWRFDHKTSVPISIVSVLDVNHPSLTEPRQANGEKTLCCWCCASGAIEGRIQIDCGGHCPGEYVNATLNINNMSKSDLHGYSVEIVQEIQLFAHGRTRRYCRILHKESNNEKIRKHIVHTQNNVTFRLPVTTPTITTAMSRIIGVNYFVRLTVKTRAGSINLRIPVPIIVGTIPKLPVYPSYQGSTSTAQNTNTWKPMTVDQMIMQFPSSSSSSNDIALNPPSYVETHGSEPEWNYQPAYLYIEPPKQNTNDNANYFGGVSFAASAPLMDEVD